MKAAVMYKPSFPLEIVDLSIENPKAGEVLVKIDATGLCASDHHVIEGVLPYPTPIVLGHEASGTIEKLGPGVSNLEVGDRCIFSFIPSCGFCFNCRSGIGHLCTNHRTDTNRHYDGTLRLKDNSGNEIYQMHKLGSFAEQQVVSEQSCFKIPDGVPSEVGALMGCCVATGIGGVINIPGVKIGSTMAVFGCGGVGLNVIQGAKLLNATQIIAVDVHDHKLEFAYKFGATHVINAKNEDAVEAIQEISKGGVDYAFDSFGSSKVMEQVMDSIKMGGTGVIVGVAPFGEKVAVDMVDMIRAEKKLYAAFYGSKTPHETFKTIVDLYISQKIDVDSMIRETYSLDQINEGFKAIETGEDGRGVIVF